LVVCVEPPKDWVVEQIRSVVALVERAQTPTTRDVTWVSQATARGRVRARIKARVRATTRATPRAKINVCVTADRGGELFLGVLRGHAHHVRVPHREHCEGRGVSRGWYRGVIV
jgi:hypothetical protein